ncbi:T9SS type A sorting domain-containing protein [Ginsengibacter hankyongi]|uniref:Aminopeptidase N n=1 Tax=Ginsengibacter hankyongi TaxID=2607284 RepID=A0A5J5ILR2_9BACT|nr:M1 family aminopeptidase [Ginsengibacter hankyongi]KAA9041671.1 T9SS type A sorting domain-containing protein [Ginsengibacter hankyongi]
MKKIIFFIISFISTAYAQSSKEYFISQKNIIAEERQAFTNALNTENASGASQNFKVSYYRCEWKVDPSVRYITGNVTSYFKLTSATDTVSFDLTDSLIVDSVIEHSKKIAFTHSNNILTIDFGASKSKDSWDSVSICYQGVPPTTGFGSFINSVHNGIPIMWTLSEPYGSRDWWPCRNGLDDKADSIDVIITNPAAYTAASNGLRQSEIINGPDKITHWKHRYPIATYLVCMAVTNYAEFKDSVQLGNINLPMQTFCYPENLSLFQANTHLVLETLKYYSSVFGNYPFIKEKYGHVQFGWGGGQEHQTSTFIVKPDENLMAHELGHQWFGDKITCASWQDIWLNEGFATHLASMDFERKYPLLVTDTRKKEIENITSLPGGSVWVDDTTNVNRIFNGRLTYTKGSHLLYMLRWKLGDSIFFKGMRRYFNDSSIAFGFAKTGDFKRNLEAVSGVVLTEFFDDWFYGQGYPSYNVQWTQIGNDYVKVKMSQVTSDPSVSFFALPVALEFKNATQQKTIVVNNTYNGEIFFNHIGFIADSVIIDPYYWLITKDNVSQKINDNINSENFVQAFPNPFTNNLSIYLHNFNNTKVYFKIYDVNGRLMYHQNFSINESLFRDINTQFFSKGVYLFSIQTGNGFKSVKKILKQ